MSITEDAIDAGQTAEVQGSASGAILYARARNPQSVSSPQFAPIEGLVFPLPPRSSGRTAALVTLSVTAPYAKGSDYPGINFSITANGNSVGKGSFTYDEHTPKSPGRVPFAMTTLVPLTDREQIVVAYWSSVRGSTGIIDAEGYASLAAVLG